MSKKNSITKQQFQQIANEFGSPVYVYHAETIQQQYQQLANAFPGIKVKLHYALKALNNTNILRLIKKEGAGLDAVSIQEVYLGLRAGFAPKEIMFTPNCVDFEEIQEAVDLGVHINIDNISVLERFGAQYGSTVPVCIRLNPHIMAGGHSHISVGHIDSKFGISIYQLRHVVRVVESLKIVVNGLHMHTGSDILDGDVFLRGAELLFEAAEHFTQLEFMDFGSGFKVAYKAGDITTDINEIGKKIAVAFKEFCQRYGRELELWFQNHLIRPMFYDAYHHIENVSNPDGIERLYSVVGYICETDTLGYDRKLNEVREGDILRIANAGAYGITMSNNYNARLRPAEVMVYKGKAHLIRKRETLDDLIQNEVELESL